MGLLFVIAAYGQSPSFKSYMNPVIPGDHPDCTVTRIGNDFCTAGSSFNPTPVIYHSTDLVHWEAIAQPVSASWLNYDDKAGGGCWGGHVVYHNGEYRYYFSRANTMFYAKAPDPKGSWSMPVAVKNPSALYYGLGQNYPNPFNPSTTIEFVLQKSAFVTLKVVNLKGEQAAILVEDRLSAGKHIIKWDGRGIASGVYFYRLDAGDFVQSKKLVLMR
jgi:hypothetical protein